MLYQVIIVIHILLGIGIIGLVLMQHGKGADAGAAFGSGASGSVFGAQGSASFLSRTTAIFAALFFTTSLGLAVLSGYDTEKKQISSNTISVEQVKSDVPLDVPLTQNKAAAELPATVAPAETIPMEKLPEAPAIKEVEKAEETQPKAK